MATIVAAAGGGNWSATGTWVGGVVPTAADDVQLSGASGNVTIDVASVCRSLDCTGYTGTLTNTNLVGLSIGDATAGAGNIALKFVAGMTYTPINTTFTFVSSSTTVQTIDFGGKSTGSLTFFQASGKWQFTSAHTCVTNSGVNLTAGTLDTNGQTCSWTTFVSTGTGIRTLTLGASSITITGTGGTSWNTSANNNLVVNAGTSTITMSGASSVFNNGSSTGSTRIYNNVVFTGASGVALTGGGTYNNVTRTGTAVKTDAFNLGGGTYTFTGTLTVNGNSATNRVRFGSDTNGTARSVTAAAVSFSNVDFNDVTALGAANWNLSAITGGAGDCTGNTGITFTTSATQFWKHGASSTHNWSDATCWFLASGGTGGAGRVPLPQDDVRFDSGSFVSAGLHTVSNDMPRMGRSIDWTGATTSPVFTQNTSGMSVFGSYTLISAMTHTWTQSGQFRGSGSYTITSAGKSYNGGTVTIAAIGGTYTLQDSLSTNNQLLLQGGTFAANGFNVSATNVVDNNISVGVTVNMGSGTWTLTGNGSFWWSISASATVNSNTSTLVFTGSTNNTFDTRGKTFNNLTITGTGVTTISGSGSFNVVTLTGTKTVTLVASTNTTITTLNAVGSAGNIITINSSIAGTFATIKMSTGVVACDYLSLKDNHATNGATFYAGSHSTDVSGNSGWIFSDPVKASLLLMGVG